VLVVFCMLGASVAGYTLIKVESIERVPDLSLPPAPEGEPENFLVVGVDTREGLATTNTDTIMLLRLDPKSDRVAMTSFPRDLMVTTPQSDELRQINGIYGAGEDGEQALIDVIQHNFDITINHFVEVDWNAFRQVVDAVGGVPVYIPYAVRDRSSGLFIPELGCVNLDGERALAFARSRKLQIQDEDGDWRQDPLSDESRIQRQQIFIQQALFTVLGQVGANPLRIRELLDIGVQNVRLDENLTLGDMLGLADQFKGFDSEQLETYYLPVQPYPEDEARLILREAEAEAYLNVFRGAPLGEVRPGLVHVSVLNGTVVDPAQARQGLATDVSGALDGVGFDVGTPGDADTFFPRTTLRHGPGGELYAERVARHITSEVAIPTEVDPALPAGEVTLVAGADFTTIHQDATPADQLPGAAEQATTTTVDATTTTTAPRPTTTTTEPSRYIVGARPDGAPC
jgi:polyisoprenyl-teichoic acid--peptidoglycan teichoic acid transferase